MKKKEKKKLCNLVIDDSFYYLFLFCKSFFFGLNGNKKEKS